jgi:hypothetical protein
MSLYIRLISGKSESRATETSSTPTPPTAIYFLADFRLQIDRSELAVSCGVSAGLGLGAECSQSRDPGETARSDILSLTSFRPVTVARKRGRARRAWAVRIVES